MMCKYDLIAFTYFVDHFFMQKIRGFTSRTIPLGMCVFKSHLLWAAKFPHNVCSPLYRHQKTAKKANSFTAVILLFAFFFVS